MSPTVVAEHVGKRYRSHTVLDDVTLTVEPGITGLLGPNGAGKTTLLRILATVLRPDTGTVRIFDRDPRDDRDRHEIRSRLGYQPQEPGFFQGFTVRDFIDYVAILKEMADPAARRDDVRRVIDQVGLTAVADRKIRKLSGGMRRRVAIAQSLLDHPQLLLLDEPTAGLDPEQRFRLRGVVSEVAADHAVVLSTHQTDDVAALCDRVIVLHEGRVRFDGSPPALTALADGHVWVGDRPHPDALLSWRLPSGQQRQLGTPPSGAELAEPTLEDGYLLLVRRGRGLGARAMSAATVAVDVGAPAVRLSFDTGPRTGAGGGRADRAPSRLPARRVGDGGIGEARPHASTPRGRGPERTTSSSSSAGSRCGSARSLPPP